MPNRSASILLGSQHWRWPQSDIWRRWLISAAGAQAAACGRHRSIAGSWQYSVRQIKPTYVGFRAHVKIASRIVSYRIAANQLHVAAAVNWRDRQTDGRTNTRPLDIRLPHTMQPTSVKHKDRLASNNASQYEVKSEWTVRLQCKSKQWKSCIFKPRT